MENKSVSQQEISVLENLLLTQMKVPWEMEKGFIRECVFVDKGGIEGWRDGEQNGQKRVFL